MIGYMVGSYKITEKIGEGGMGAVFRAIDVMLEREVAIKMLRPELARQPDLVERFRSEAVTLARLNHPNIATLYSFIRQGDDFFMIMEYVRGETLESLITRFGRLDCEPAVSLFCQALEGIEQAHRLGIVHRDIKPANMMLTDAGVIKVMDFGIARVLGTGRITKTGHLIGTVEYMSPEQIRGQETGTCSDIYSLGILLYEMLTGRVPFTSTSEYELMRAQIEEAPTPPSRFVGQVPLPIEQAIMRALAKKTEARYQTAGEFRAALLPGLGEAAGYRGPAIHMNHLRASDPRVEAAIKETRLPGHSGDPGFAAGNQIPGTRLGPSGSVQPAGGQPQATQSLVALLNRFTWKHYAIVAALLAFVICTPLAFIGGKTPASQPAKVAAPKPSPPIQQEVAPIPAPPAVQPVDSPVLLPPGEQTAVDSSAAKPSGSTPKRGTRTEAAVTELNRERRRPVRAEAPRRSAPPAEERRAARSEPEPASKKEKKPWWKKASEMVKGAGDAVDGIRKLRRP